MGALSIFDILIVSRSRNSQLGITGVLYDDGQHFMQVLEGPRRNVDSVFDSIVNDRRHTDISVIGREARLRRDFSSWTMAFVSQEQLTKLAAPHHDASAFADFPSVPAFVATMQAALRQGTA
jgi:hypothetical protein